MKYPRKFGYAWKKNRVPQVSEKKPNTLKALGQAVSKQKIFLNHSVSKLTGSKLWVYIRGFLMYIHNFEPVRYLELICVSGSGGFGPEFLTWSMYQN